MGEDSIPPPSEGVAEMDSEETLVSLCSDCAVHPSLKRIVEADAVAGLCAFCGRANVLVRNPETSNDMIMLIRALIRFVWDEFEYNPHWGGDDPLTLFETENPIVRPFQTTAYRDDFDELLQFPPYPPTSEGVAIYAGSDGGTRLLNFAISRTAPDSFHRVRGRLMRENFYEVAPDLETMVAPFLDDIAIQMDAGEVWYRARIGQEAKFRRVELGEFRSAVVRQPWSGDRLGAPPPQLAGIGRLNRAGVSMLYVASDAYTAMAEIRPHPGHHVSIGTFRCREALRLADFDADIGLFCANDDRLDLFALIHALDKAMSLPVVPEERSSYLLTQLLSEVLLKNGFDGVRYRSSVSDGINVCLFRPSKMEFVENSARMVTVSDLRYGTVDVPIVLHPGSDLIRVRE